MITITINGKEIKLEKPVTVFEAAKQNGIKIPHFCHHPMLEKWGGCRMCLVEVEKMPRLQTSCTLTVTDGMVVRTESEEISKARKGVLEFLLINHPLDCPYCDKAGECKLQDYTLQYGAAAGRFIEGKRKHPESFDDPLIVRNMERCILCTRCVRMCSGVQGASALTVTSRGTKSFVEPFSGGRYNCEYCGNCLTVCPVGAIMSRLHRHEFRSWFIERDVKTVCSFCGVGCGFVIQVRGNKIIRTLPRPEVGINKGILCAKGRFGYGYVEGSRRLAAPMIKKDGKFEAATWDEAITLVAGRLKDIKERHGSESIGGIASARCTNEENYLFQKLMRAGLKTNNIDSIAATGFGPAQRFIEEVLGQGATANLISGIPKSEGVLVVGGDPTHINPVLGIQIREAFRRKASVFTIGYTPGLERFRTNHLNPHPFTEGSLLSAMLKELVRLKGDMSGENKEFESKIKGYEGLTIEDAVKICNVRKDDIIKAANDLSRLASLSVIIGPDVIQRKDAGTTLFIIIAIAYILNARVYLLSDRPNIQGAIDMGCTNDALPGNRPVDMETFRKREEEVWGCDLPDKSGLTLTDMIESAESGTLKALYIMGDNPAYNLPDSTFVKSAIKKTDFVVVQDMFMTETAEMADVVLPSLGWSEKDGTYTNLERRIQRLRKAVDKDGMEDWRIISEIGKRLGLKMDYGSSADIMSEISMVSPLHAGLNYDELEKGMDLWPYKGEPLRRKTGGGTLEPGGLWKPAGGDRIYLGIQRHMFLSGSMWRHSAGLNSIYEEPLVYVSPAVAEISGLLDGDYAEIKTEKGLLVMKIKTDRELVGKIVLVTNNFRDFGGLGLFPYVKDHASKVPCLDSVEVSLRKAGK